MDQDIDDKIKKRRDFLATDLGKKYSKFKNKYFTTASDEWNENVTPAMLVRHDFESREAEDEFLNELFKLLEKLEKIKYE